MANMDHNDQSVHRLSCAIITVSDSRTAETDHSGQTIRRLLESADHVCGNYEIIPDEKTFIQSAMHRRMADPSCDAILITGGTGIAPRDVTYEAANELLEKRLEGFGELFRAKSYEEIGPKAILSRALAGIAQNTVVFVMPGSTNAVKLAMNDVVLPILPHVVALVRS
jgi:molybdopterin adenylyltransferase